MPYQSVADISLIYQADTVVVPAVTAYLSTNGTTDRRLLYYMLYAALTSDLTACCYTRTLLALLRKNCHRVGTTEELSLSFRGYSSLHTANPGHRGFRRKRTKQDQASRGDAAELCPGSRHDQGTPLPEEGLSGLLPNDGSFST